MIDLRQIEQYIDNLLKSTDLVANKMLHATLEKIKLHLEDYKRTESSHYLLEIRRFIESIKLVSLSSSFSLFRSNSDNCAFMGDMLANKNFGIITIAKERADICARNGMPDLALSKTVEQILGWIYQTIAQKFPVSSIAWDATFAKNQDGVIISNHISEWQSYMQTITSPQQAVRDFRRDIKILGVNPATFKSDEDAIKQLQELIDQSSYTENEKQHIKAWMLAKAGQEMNFFITDMIRSQSLFSVPVEMLNDQHENIFSTASYATDNNWSIDRNGKIIYHQNMHIKHILNGNDCILARNLNGDVTVIHSHKNNNEFEAALIAKPSQDTKFLASINSHARLDINDQGTVTPSILSLNITSQTSMIQPPNSIQLTAEATTATTATAAAAAAATTVNHLHRPHSSHF